MRIGILSLLCLVSCFGCEEHRKAAPPDPPKFNLSGEFTVSVDYSLSIELVVARGFKIDVLPPENADLFSDRHFPRTDTGIVDLRMRIASFPNAYRMTLNEQLLILDQHGLWPANLPELLAFAVKHTCLVIPGDLVATDSVPQVTTKDLGRVLVVPYVPMEGCRFDDVDANQPKPSLKKVLWPLPSEANSGFIPVFYLLTVEK